MVTVIVHRVVLFLTPAFMRGEVHLGVCKLHIVDQDVPIPRL